MQRYAILNFHNFCSVIISETVQIQAEPKHRKMMAPRVIEALRIFARKSVGQPIKKEATPKLTIQHSDEKEPSRAEILGDLNDKEAWLKQRRKIIYQENMEPLREIDTTNSSYNKMSPKPLNRGSKIAFQKDKEPLIESTVDSNDKETQPKQSKKHSNRKNKSEKESLREESPTDSNNEDTSLMPSKDSPEMYQEYKEPLRAESAVDSNEKEPSSKQKKRSKGKNRAKKESLRITLSEEVSSKPKKRSKKEHSKKRRRTGSLTKTNEKLSKRSKRRSKRKDLEEKEQEQADIASELNENETSPVQPKSFYKVLDSEKHGLLQAETSSQPNEKDNFWSNKQRPKIMEPPATERLRTPLPKRRRRGDISIDDFLTPKRINDRRYSLGQRFSHGSYGFKEELKAAEQIKALNGKMISCFFTKVYAFSNHFTRRDLFEVDGKKFICSEQYYMFYKARVFGDMVTARAIMSALDGRTMKRLGSHIEGFDLRKWRPMALYVMVIASLKKYEQNADFRQLLFDTGDSVIAEASPDDIYWGIGRFMHDPMLKDTSSWPGANVLGRILMEVRRRLRAREEFRTSTSTPPQTDTNR